MRKTNEEGNQKKKRLWTKEEDKILMDYVSVHGKRHWNRVSKNTGLKRCGKSCRLRWMNYLSPNVIRGNFTKEEEELIIRLHKLLGNRWSLIAKRVPGRTDNQVKNYWNTRLIKKLASKEHNSRLGIATKPSKKAQVSSSTSCLSDPLGDSSSSACIQSSSTNEIAVDKRTQRPCEVLSIRESMIKDGHMGSFWIADDALELSTFSSMDFLDGYY